MFDSFWSGLAGIAIFITTFLAWSNGRKLNVLENKLDKLKLNIFQLRADNLGQTNEDEVVSDNPTESQVKSVDKKQNNKPTLVGNMSEKPITNVALVNAQTKSKKSEKIIKPKSDRKVWAFDATPPPIKNTKPSIATSKKVDWPKPDKVKAPANTVNIWEKYSSLEFDLGAKLPVWLGSIALIIAGFFFVKYSVENNLVPPYARLIGLFLLGLAMLYGAYLIRKRPKFANGRRISQALTGVGFAIIYGVLYAGSQVWHYVPVPVAMLGMIITTLAALYMSIKYGIGIAYLSLLTGYLTPILMNSKESSTLFLFAYLLGIFAAMAYVAKLQKWWDMLLILLVGNFAWVLYWFNTDAASSDAIWLYMFLIGQSALIIWSSKPLRNIKIIEEDKQAKTYFSFVNTLNIIAHIGGLVFITLVMHLADFGMLDWAVFTLVLGIAITLCSYDEDNYIYLPFATSILGGFMLASWQSAELLGFSIQLLLTAVILVGYGFYQITKSNYARAWAFLSSLTALAYFVIYYDRESLAWFRGISISTNLADEVFASLAIVLSSIFSYAYYKISKQKKIVDQTKIMANFAATATAFLSIAITIYIDKGYWPIAFGFQMVALSYIDAKLKNKIIRTLTILMAIVIVSLILPNAAGVVDYMLNLTFGNGPFFKFAWNETFLNAPLLYLGVPTISLAATAYFMRQHLDDFVVKTIETVALTLFTITGYLVIRYAFNGDNHIHDFSQSMFETGVITAFIFVVGLVSLYMAKTTGRQAYITRGWLNIVMAFGRIIIFDIFTYNPLFNSIEIGGTVILNPLFFTYALPIFAVFAVEYLLPKATFKAQIKALKIFSGLLFFVFINLNIRFAYQDYIAYWNHTGIAELYTYSLIWLLFGITLLVIAIWQKQKIIRFASQAIIMLTVTKVFLYDSAFLEDLYRIASFALLGICLISISYVYSKYILIEDNENSGSLDKNKSDKKENELPL